MGLKDLFTKSKVEYDIKKIDVVDHIDQSQPVQQTIYDRHWLDRVVDNHGFVVQKPDSKIDNILNALTKRNGQCPCGGNTPQFKCPCEIMRECGVCKCGMFETVTTRDPKGGTEIAGIKRNK